MKKITKALFSLQLSAALMFIFLAVIGIATFVEKYTSTSSAKALIYNSRWFEFLLFLIALNLIGSTIKLKMYRKEKLTIFIFHIAFFIMILGAAFTRFFGYEGEMRIPEGMETNKMVSTANYLNYDITDGNEGVKAAKELLVADLGSRKFKEKISIGNETVTLKYKNYVSSAFPQIEESPNGQLYISVFIVDTANKNSFKELILGDKEVRRYGNLLLSLNNDLYPDAINFIYDNNNLSVKSENLLRTGVMMKTTKKDTILPGSLTNISTQSIVSFRNFGMIVKEIVPSGNIILNRNIQNGNAMGDDALVVTVMSNNEESDVVLFGFNREIGSVVTKKIGNLNASLSFGAVEIVLPFTIHLTDFQMERYLGSNSPSSYASEIILKDQEKNIEMPYRIYMNHVLDHRGFRFFQSSYFPDESGTILSVNHDKLGTNVTYLSYILLAIGMFISILNKNSRIVYINKMITKVKKARIGTKSGAALVFLFLSLSFNSGFSQGIKYVPIDPVHAEKFGELLVQDNSGRIEPLNTKTSEIVRKITRKSEFKGLTSDQVFLDMMVNPTYWRGIDMIKFKNDQLKDLLNAEGKYISYNDLINPSDGSYKLGVYVNQANQKHPRARGKFDKEVIAVDERLNISYYVYNYTFFNVFPKQGDKTGKWVSPNDISRNGLVKDTAVVFPLIRNYLNAVVKAKQTGEWSVADKYLENISQYQRTYGASVIPPQKIIDKELKYNKLDAFNRLTHYYNMFGAFLLILNFITILIPRFKIKWIIRVFAIFIGLLFAVHTYGLYTRWIIGGHAPWSNAYESMVFIAWATILAGFIFMRKSQIALTAASMMAAMILMVAHLNWLDPEITPLVPVLKSYWLVIHVATITMSYGFLGLGMLLGFFAMIVMILRNDKNRDRLNLTIAEFSYVNESTLQIGLILLTIGTFLGGVWANESWGRYWGWDPKETWSLVTILVYSLILHARFIPGFRGFFAFNFMSVIGFASVLMTYFGVNYYLAGLHSYAKGEASPLPPFAYYTLLIIFIVGISALYSDYKNKRITNGMLPPLD